MLSHSEKKKQAVLRRSKRFLPESGGPFPQVLRCFWFLSGKRRESPPPGRRGECEKGGKGEPHLFPMTPFASKKKGSRNPCCPRSKAPFVAGDRKNAPRKGPKKAHWTGGGGIYSWDYYPPEGCPVLREGGRETPSIGVVGTKSGLWKGRLEKEPTSQAT